MSTAKAFLAEFEQEAALTRPFLERLPEPQLDWRPHEKSMTVGQLGFHIATVPGFIINLIQQDEVPAPDFGRPNPQPASVAEVLAAFDQSVATVQALLPKLDDAAMARSWSAMANGQAILTMPRAAVVRAIMLSHWIQHRGQLGVFLRLLDIPVPSTYGPSRDELPAFLRKTA